jgi:hypothetical protein
MGWSTEAAQEILARLGMSMDARKWAMFVREQINQQADGLFEELAKQVIADTEEFDNGRKGNSGLRAEHRIPNNITVQRYLKPLRKLEFVYAPHRKVDVFFNGEITETFEFDVDDRGAVWFMDLENEKITVEGVSRRSFEPLIDLYRRIPA